ncbi:MAG: proline--tRNA ligase [bacterium]
MYEKKNLPKRDEIFSEWYTRVILDAQLAEYGPVKGTMIIRPYGYAIWENLQKAMDKEIKAMGVENAYFPLFIPESFLSREKDHVEGFSPELAVVTHAGGEELVEKVVVRPTSETIMYDTYSKWVESWRDLPILVNQWNNVVRWEKRTALFLRTSEFLWQEGHTAHATHKESWDYVKWAMDMYAKIYRENYAIPGIVGRKSESEKFAGAVATLTYESLMPDGKALQSGTSHDLGQNFSKAFDISFQDKEGQKQFVWQTSWGFSTRSIGGLIMVHGDDQGLKLPPMLAPTQVVIIPVVNDENIIKHCEEIKSLLLEKNISVKFDSRDDERLGFKINKWELRGVPIRLEIGKNEVAADSATVVRRDNREKTSVEKKVIVNFISESLQSIQKDMYDNAVKFLEDNTHIVNDYAEFKSIMEGNRGFLKAMWCENADCEDKIKEETKASTRCLPIDSVEEQGKCIYCGKEAKHRWVFAQSY